MMDMIDDRVIKNAVLDAILDAIKVLGAYAFKFSILMTS